MNGRLKEALMETEKDSGLFQELSLGALPTGLTAEGTNSFLRDGQVMAKVLFQVDIAGILTTHPVFRAGILHSLAVRLSEDRVEAVRLLHQAAYLLHEMEVER